MVVVEHGSEEKAVRRRPGKGNGLSAVPLLSLPLLLYVALALAGLDFNAPRFEITLPSAGIWKPTLGDIVLAVGLFFLFFEIIKATRTGGASVLDHAISMIVFVACLILFLIWDKAATTTFFLLMVMALIDVIAGFSVTIVSARRDYAIGGHE
jgi:hypothetical protein